MTAIELLRIARAAERSGERDQATQAFLSAGAGFADEENLLAAAAAYAEGARIASYASEELFKMVLADSQSLVMTKLRAQELTPPQRIAAAFQHAARYWSPDGAPFMGHRGLCAHCGAPLALTWVRCARCNTPRLTNDRGERLMLSERVCGPSALEGPHAAELRTLLPTAARIFDELLWFGSPPRFPHPENLVPGALKAAASEDQSRAALLEVVVGDELIETKEAFCDFVGSLGEALLAGRVWQSELEEPRRALQRIFGASITVRRTMRLEVRHGVTGICGTRVSARAGHKVSRAESRQHVVSAVAVEAEHEHDAKPLIADFAQDLAYDLLLTDCESISPDGDFTTDVCELLKVRRFHGDSSLTAAEAAELLGAYAHVGLSVAGAARFVRESFYPEDPEAFPSEQAMRA